MYLDSDGTTVVNAYDGESIGIVIDDVVRIDARKVLDLVSKLAHSNGEPGVLFFDRMNEFNANLYDEEQEATNPCGEQPLPPYDACNLGSINLGKFVNYSIYSYDDKIDLEERILEDKFTKTGERRADGKTEVIWLDRDGLTEAIHDGVRFLDNVIDRSDYPASKITKAVQENRNIGLGYMGVYDAMVLMKIRYGSEESFEFAEELAKVLSEESLVASQQIAEERGAYPLYETSFHNPDSELHSWMTSDPKTIVDKFRGERKLSDQVDRERVMTYGGGPIRNSARLTQAPTGTIRRTTGHKLESLAMDNLAISSGIEPMFSLYEESNILNATFNDWSSAAVQLLEREGLNVEEVLDAIQKNRGSAFVYEYTPEEVRSVLEEIPEDVRDVLVTAAGGEGDEYEITARQHARMLTTFQKYNDSAISKTINLPQSATVGDVRETWVDLWRQGAKGATAYVDQSREFQILNVSMEDHEDETSRGGKRPLLQSSITIELPYISSSSREDSTTGDVDFNPERVFTTIAYNPINGHITGIFQNIPEVDPERLSTLMEVNIDKSRALKQGRSLDEVIADIEKISQTGVHRGLVVDEAVMPQDSNERMRFQVGGATTGQARLNSLYVMRFLTDGGSNFDGDAIREKLDVYFSGEVSLKSILNTRGKLELKEGSERPSILSNGKVVTLPEKASGIDCPECDPI